MGAGLRDHGGEGSVASVTMKVKSDAPTGIALELLWRHQLPDSTPDGHVTARAPPSFAPVVVPIASLS